jgi:hypothetical protein
LTTSINVEKPRGNLKVGTNYSAIFIYLSQGIEFSAEFPKRTDFDSNLILTRPIFFAPTKADPSKNQIIKEMIAWEGFSKGFDFYNANCRPSAVCNYTDP